MSWWVMGVLIDFSIVATAAVSSLPLQVMEKQRSEMKFDMTVPKELIIRDGGLHGLDQDATEANYKKLDLEQIMPAADNVA